jgi:hypothetical protein
MTAPVIPLHRVVERHCPGTTPGTGQPCRTWRLTWPGTPWPVCWRCGTLRPAIPTSPDITFATFRPTRGPR